MQGTIASGLNSYSRLDYCIAHTTFQHDMRHQSYRSSRHARADHSGHVLTSALDLMQQSAECKEMHGNAKRVWGPACNSHATMKVQAMTHQHSNQIYADQGAIKILVQISHVSMAAVNLNIHAF